MSCCEKLGFIEDNNGRSSFFLRISEPVERREPPLPDDYFCVIRCPVLFEDDQKIYGVDPDQAMELSLMYVRKKLQDKRIFDQTGQRIEI